MSRFLFPQEIPFQTQQDGMAAKLISGITRQNMFMGRTLFYPSWLLRYYTPQAYKQLREAVRDVFEAGGHFVEDIYRTLSVKVERGEVVEPRSLLEHWILNGELPHKEVLTNTTNMLAGGLDTVRPHTHTHRHTHCTVFGSLNSTWLALTLLFLPPLQTANTSAFLLHLVATNPRVQDALHREVVAAAGTDGPITADVLSQLPLVKGCIKEALR